MSVEDQYRSVVARLRARGVTVVEMPNCYGYGNQIGQWKNGKPDGAGRHHFVCSLNPAQSYIDGLVQMLRVGYGDLAGAGAVVNWFVDVHGVAYLIATRPANHFGKGDSSVLARVMRDQAPVGVHPPNNDYNGNANFTGIECQHPGDSTPWPSAEIDTVVAISGAEALEFGWTANRIIQHKEHTNRKTDMSFMGDAGGAEIRRRVAVWMGGSTKPSQGGATSGTTADGDDDEVIDYDKLAKAILDSTLNYAVLVDDGTGTGKKKETQAKPGYPNPGSGTVRDLLQSLAANTARTQLAQQ